jgi:hypothetical protein
VDLHQNLFYSYRGPNTDDADRDRQLENNLTKALITTLKLGGEPVWRPFLAELGLAGVPRDFLLQRRDLPGGAASKRHRVLLGISKEESAWAHGAGAETTYESLPDAWVYGDGFAVLVETKVNGDFSPGQMEAHYGRLQPKDGAPPMLKLTTWKEIHRLFSSFLPRLTDSASLLLVKQFSEFLEYCGMSGFTGFRREHFDYFVLHDDDDARRWVREQVEDFATQVQAILHRFAPFYEGYEIGTLKRTDSYCWFAFGPPGTYRIVTHQTMSLAANGLSVFVNTELKAATDQLKRVVRKAGNVLRDALQELHLYEPFELVLQERTQRQASLYEYTPKMRLHSSMLADVSTREVAWTAFSQTVQQLPLLQLSIERLVPPSRLLELSKSDPPEAVQKVVEILKRNHAVVNLLNE